MGKLKSYCAKDGKKKEAPSIDFKLKKRSNADEAHKPISMDGEGANEISKAVAMILEDEFNQLITTYGRGNIPRQLVADALIRVSSEVFNNPEPIEESLVDKACELLGSTAEAQDIMNMLEKISE